MRINTAKAKMLEGHPAFGYALALGSPEMAEVLGESGIDFLLLDRQHGSWGEDSTIRALAYLARSEAVPMARVATNHYDQIGRLLDEGMLGIVVPMVDTPEQAQAAADACRFPPLGKRSYGWGRARVYGSDYPYRSDAEVFLAIQLESATAVENAEAILSTPGIDGCWVGPADLAFSMGFHPDEIPQRDEHQRALESVVQACRNTGTIPGIAGGTPEDGLRYAAMGFQFITAGSDIGFLSEGAIAGAAKLSGITT
jgi:2-keto-3-deoxy-L-rhamnonate aldolase RhmA